MAKSKKVQATEDSKSPSLLRRGEGWTERRGKTVRVRREKVTRVRTSFGRTTGEIEMVRTSMGIDENVESSSRRRKKGRGGEEPSRTDRARVFENDAFEGSQRRLKRRDALWIHLVDLKRANEKISE